MATNNRVDLWQGKDPIETLSESLVQAEARLSSFRKMTDELTSSIGALKTQASSLKGAFGVDNGGQLANLEKQNSLHRESITLLTTDKELRKSLAAAQKAEQKAIEESEKAYERLIQEIKKREAAEEKAFNKREAQYNKEVAASNKQLTIYQQVQSKLTRLITEQQNLGVRRELGLKITDQEIKRYEFLTQRIQKYDGVLKIVDATSGKYQRNVGNYASGWNGLGNSINQLTRELPAFANSLQTGFLAISNNLPTLFDEIQRIRVSNDQLAASGQKTQSVFKQLGAAVFSFGTALSLGVTLLTVYGKDIVEFFGDLFAGKEVLTDAQIAQEGLTKANEDARTAISAASEAVKKQQINFELAREGVISKKQALNSYNKEFGPLLGNAKTLNEAEALFTAKTADYLKSVRLRALANSLYQQAAEQYSKSVTASLDDNISAAETVKLALTNVFSNQEELTDAYVKKQAEGTVAAKKSYQQREKVYNDEADKLYEEAVRLEKNSGITTTHTEKKKKDNKTRKEGNDLIQKTIDLLKEEQEIIDRMAGESFTSDLAQSIINQEKAIAETGRYSLDIIRQLIEAEKERKLAVIERQYAEERNGALAGSIQEEIAEKNRNERLLALEQELADKRTEIEEKFEKDQEARRDKIAAQREAELQNVINGYIRETDERRLQALRGNLTDEQLEKEATEAKIAELEKRIEAEYQAGKDTLKLEIELAELRRKEEEKEKKAREKHLKDLLDQSKKYLDETIKLLIKESEEKEKQIDKEISQSEKLEDDLKAAANAGNDTAQQSLAVQKQVTAEKLSLKEKEQREQETLRRIEAGYEIFIALLNQGKSPGVATVQSVGALTLLEKALKGIKGFFSGTDDTGTVSNPLDSKGGRIAVLHDNELVMSKKERALTGNKTRAELIKASQFYDTFRVNSQLATEAIKPIRTDITHDPIIPQKLDRVIEKLDKIPKEFFSAEVIGGVLTAFHVSQTGNDEKRTFKNT